MEDLLSMAPFCLLRKTYGPLCHKELCLHGIALEVSPELVPHIVIAQSTKFRWKSYGVQKFS